MNLPERLAIAQIPLFEKHSSAVLYFRSPEEEEEEEKKEDK